MYTLLVLAVVLIEPDTRAFDPLVVTEVMTGKFLKLICTGIAIGRIVGRDTLRAEVDSQTLLLEIEFPRIALLVPVPASWMPQ